MVLRQLSSFLTTGAILLATALSGGGCALVRIAAAPMVAATARDMSVSFQRQSDLETVREGVPSFLLMLDGLIESSPRDPTLLLVAADAYTSYASAFVDEEDKARASAMYAKARDYGLRVLCRNKRFRRVAGKPLSEFETAIPHFRRRDVPALFSTGMAWTKWILRNTDSMEAMAQLSKPVALMRRVLELDPGYQGGGSDMFFGIYYAAQPRGAGRDLEKSKHHFEAAMRFAGAENLLPSVAYAEFYARYAFDQPLFENVLKRVLENDTDAPERRLLNAVARKRARVLLERVDDFF